MSILARTRHPDWARRKDARRDCHRLTSFALGHGNNVCAVLVSECLGEQKTNMLDSLAWKRVAKESC
jgi:hypothetical protein